MSIPAAGPAAAKVAAGGSRAAASKRWAGKQAQVLRGRGMSDAEIRKSLKGAGYDATTAKAAAPSPAPATPAPAPAAKSAPAPITDKLSKASIDRANYLQSPKPISGNRVGSGLLLGLVLYPVALAFLRDGVPGMKAWFAAKFLNRVSAPLPRPGTTTAKPVVV